MDKLLPAIYVSLIFFVWCGVNYLLGNDPREYYSLKGLLIPLIWSAFFLYLRSKHFTLLALYSYSIFLLFLIADLLNFQSTTRGMQVAYSLMPICNAFLVIFLFQNIFPKKAKLATISGSIVAVLLIGLPLFYIIYAVNFGTAITREIFYVIMQTNYSEALSFVSGYVSYWWYFVIAVIIMLSTYFFIHHERKDYFAIEASLSVFMILVLVTLSFQIRKDNRLLIFASSSIIDYKNELAVFEALQNRIKNRDINFEAEKDAKGETYIVVIGESLNKDHMGLYGYMRNTTPLLDEKFESGEILKFDNAVASHTHTMEVLSLSLTQANQLNTKSYFNSLSIINVLNHADVETYWLTNQNMFGQWDNLVSIVANQADHLIPFNQNVGNETVAKHHDGIILDELSTILGQKADKNRVIFVHLMGNHINYCSRYPDDFQLFSGSLNVGEFGRLAKYIPNFESLNCYDNSVLYGDHVLSTIIDELKTLESVNGLLFFSDHGEDVLKDLAHNSSLFTFSMVKIPLIMWFSEQYKEEYPEKFKFLKQRQNDLFSNDFIYDSLIGLFDVTTDQYTKDKDISSNIYKLDADDVYTMHGKIMISDEKNYAYHIKNNVKALKEINLDSKIFPHRVNTLGKLDKLMHEGVRSFEVDVLFENDRFMVGHDHGTLSGVLFENLIADISINEIDKIWLDVKNVNDENIGDILNHLNLLDQKHSLKDKLVFESDTKLDRFNAFSDSGWHTSYYLPTEVIIQMMEQDDVEKMREFALEINEQIIRQKTLAVSFDVRAYPFVKNYIEPISEPHIVYHLWDLEQKLHAQNLLSSIEVESYFDDEKVKSILVQASSQFDL